MVTNASTVNNSTTLESQGALRSGDVNVAPAPVHVGVLNNQAQLRQFLESAEGRAVIFDLVASRKTDLGIRS
jgi:hypothetical protein